MILPIVFLCFSQNLLFSQKVGLVLSGGGAKGAVHIGLIKALEDNQIPIDYISGTSIGAIVGSLYAMGYTPNEMLDLFLSENFYDWQSGTIAEDYNYYFRKPDPSPEFTKFMVPLGDSIDFTKVIMPNSLINPSQMNQAFMGIYAQSNALCGGDYDKLFIPFLCVASDLYNKKAHIMRSGNLGNSVRASMTFPLFFKPIIIEGIPLYDGGIYDNFPVKPLIEAHNPDFIIGSSVASGKNDPLETSLYKQLSSMIMQKTDYSIDENLGLMIKFELHDVNLLDFNKSQELFDIGYNRGLEMVDSIKQRTSRTVSRKELSERRDDFKNKLPALKFIRVIVSGCTEAQKKYILDQIQTTQGEPFTMEEFRKNYFKLLSNTKIKELIPLAIYNEEDGFFELYLEASIKNEIGLSFGGNIASSNANQLYLGLGYQSLTEYSTDFNLGLQAGNAFNGALLRGRVEFPSKNPFYINALFSINHRKYYESDKLFMDTELSTFVKQREIFGRLGFGLPFKTKARLEMNISYGGLQDRYSQTNTGSFFDINLDESHYKQFSFASSIKKNTLNAKQYPTLGQEHSIIAQYLSSLESFMPAERNALNKESNQTWLQIGGKINNFHSLSSKFNLGYLTEFCLSSKNLFNNYTSSILQAPSFTPTPHSLLAFNEFFRANQFLAAGITPIYKLNKNAHLRGDLDVFVPLYAIKRKNTSEVYYGDLFRDYALMGEVTFVYHLPFLTISLYANRYSSPKQNWNFGLNIGYLIFFPKFIQ